ncbi:hypothetical protein FIU92_02025 [Ruegeria sp. THAF33]|nr:ATP-binding protein [Ruegeria sp. THAF33]QFT71792.1 hypothetical protein FIU92_02025 [Ruegeria sp. THAF33]
MTDRLEEERFLCITGPSGCGKSSLARTGLISGLRAGQIEGCEDWIILEMLPGNDPIKALISTISDSLAEVFAEPETANQLPVDFELHRLIARSLEQAHYSLSRVLSSYSLFKQQPILLLVDQFEELFEYAKMDRAGAARFVHMLLDALRPAEGVNLYVVVTIRADALDSCSRYEGLAEAINRGQFLTPALTREELSEIVRGPVALHNGDVDPPFVGWLLNEMANEPDRLPLMQHVMNILWEDEAKRIELEVNETQHPHFDIDDFKRNFPNALARARSSGDALRFALSDRLDEVFDALEERLKPLCEKIFCALVEVFAGDKDIKRRLTIHQLAEVCAAPEDDIKKVVDHFRKPGCQYLHPIRPINVDGITDTTLDDTKVYVTDDLASDTVVRVMHECLLRQWRRLRFDWLRNHERAITELQFLARTAMSHARQGGALLSDTQIRTYSAWRERHSPTVQWGAPFLRTLDWREDGRVLTPEEVYEHSADFLKFCEDDMRARKEQERHKKKRRRVLFQISGVATLGVAFVAAVSWYKERQIATNAEVSYFNAELEAAVLEQKATEIEKLAEPGGTGKLVYCSDLESGVGILADGNVDDTEFDCVADFNEEQIQTLSEDLQQSGQVDENNLKANLKAAVSRAAEEQKEEALARAATQGIAETGQKNETVADVPPVSPDQTDPLIEASLRGRILECEGDEILTSVSNLEIETWQANKTVPICTPVEDRSTFADIPQNYPDAEKSFELGRRQLNRQQNEAALQSFGLVHQEEPNIPRVFRHAGWAYFGEGDDGSAWTCFRNALTSACNIEDESNRDEQLVWSWSNLTVVPARNGDVLISSAAWAQKALLYDEGKAYSKESLETQPRHHFRRFEANLNAYRGFFELGGCEIQSSESGYCEAADNYLKAANKHLVEFVRVFPSENPTSTQISLLSTAAWEWTTDEVLQTLDKEGWLTREFTLMLKRVAEKSDASGLYIPLSLIVCEGGDVVRAVAYQDKWPTTAFSDRKERALACIEKN